MDCHIKHVTDVNVLTKSIKTNIKNTFGGNVRVQKDDLGWRMHGSVEDTKLSTNKQHSLSLMGRHLPRMDRRLAAAPTSSRTMDRRLGARRTDRRKWIVPSTVKMYLSPVKM